MARLPFQLLTPDGQVYDGPVEYVGVRGLEGDLGVMAGHMPSLVACRAGLVRVRVTERDTRLFVADGGLLSVHAEGATLLAGRAEAVADEAAGRRLAAKWTNGNGR